jgi:hypothetical protein
MQERVPIANIAALEGIDDDYARKATRRLAAAYGVEYTPTKKENDLALLTEASAAFRRRIADVVYRIRNKPGAHPIDIAHATGLSQEEQKLANERGGAVNLKLSQLERIAAADGQDFKSMVLWAVLSPEEYQKVSRCLNN